MTILKKLAAAGALTLCAGAAQAATFEFEFLILDQKPCIECEEEIIDRVVIEGPIEPVPTIQVGSGTLSFDGDVVDGDYGPGDLTNFMFDFQFENGSAFDEEDPIFSFFGAPRLSVSTNNGVTSALLGASFFGDTLLRQEVPANCTFGQIGIQNDAGTCLNFGFPIGVALDAQPDPNALLGQFSLISASTGPQQFDQGDFQIFGRYTAVLVDDGPAPVPLPAALPLLAVALGGLGIARRKRT